MQGSHVGELLHPQGYRQLLRDLLDQHFPGCTVYDPLADHPNSLDYDDQQGREVFLRHNRLCRAVDVLIAFVPEASMGTAIEMWEASQNGGIVLTITPLVHNWAVKFCSHAVFADWSSFQQALESGTLQENISQWKATKASSSPVNRRCDDG
jgi:hypothetical protein